MLKRHTLLLNYYITDAMHTKELEFPKKLVLRDGKVWESVACWKGSMFPARRFHVDLTTCQVTLQERLHPQTMMLSRTTP